MTITSGDLIYATDFTNLVTKINSKITEANQNDANISRLEMDYSHPIGKNQEIHHENANRIIDKYNELITNSENMSENQLLNLIQSGQVIQNSFNIFKTIVDNIDGVLFEASIGSLQIKGPFEINENRSERYRLDKAVEGGTGWEQVTTGINWSLSGSGAGFCSINPTSGYLKTDSVPSDQQITIHANYTDNYGTHSTTKDIVIKRIAEIVGLEIQSIDGSGQNIIEGDKHRYKCTAILDEMGSTQLLAGGFNWISTNPTKLLLDDVFNDPDYPGIKIAEITTTNIDKETESVILKASYKGKYGQKSLIISNAASIVSIYIEDENENAEIRTVEGESQTLNAYGFTSDNDREAILLDQEDLTWEIHTNNNTGSRFDNNQFVPGTMISGDTPVTIKCTYRKGTSEQKYVTREVIIEKNADVVAIAIYRQGSSDDPLSALNVLEDSETQLGCTVYFSDNTSDTDPDARFVSWTFDNISDAILSGTAIDSETGLLETGEISQDLALQLRVSYRGFDGTRELIVRNINSVKIGTFDGDIDTEITIDEGTAFSFRLYALHNVGKTLISGDLDWEFWKDNSSHNPSFANVNRRTGEVSANNNVTKDELTQLKCTWVTARTERMYTAYKAVRFHDTNYPISLEIDSPGILYEGQSMFLTAKATLDNGDEITVEKDDPAMNWSIQNYNGISSNLLTINSEGMLTLEDVNFNTKTILVIATYAKNGQSKSKTISVELQGIFIEKLEIYGITMNRLSTRQTGMLKCREIYNYGTPRDTIDGVVWSISGSSNGCSINSSTGALTAGTQLGSITVRATKDGASGEKNIVLVQGLDFSVVNPTVTYSGGEWIFNEWGKIRSNVVNYNDLYIEFCVYNYNDDLWVRIITGDPGLYGNYTDDYFNGSVGHKTLQVLDPPDSRQTADFIGLHIKNRVVRLCTNGLWDDTYAKNVDQFAIEVRASSNTNSRLFINTSNFKVNIPDKIYYKDEMNRYTSEETWMIDMEVSDTSSNFRGKENHFIKAGWKESSLEIGAEIKEFSGETGLRRIKCANKNDARSIFFKVSESHYYTPKNRDFLPDQFYVQDDDDDWPNDYVPTPFPVEFEINIEGIRPVLRGDLYFSSYVWYFYWEKYDLYWKIPFITHFQDFRIPQHDDFFIFCKNISKIQEAPLNVEFIFKLLEYDNHIVKQKLVLLF